MHSIKLKSHFWHDIGTYVIDKSMRVWTGHLDLAERCQVDDPCRRHNTSHFPPHRLEPVGAPKAGFVASIVSGQGEPVWLLPSYNFQKRK